MSLRLKRVKDQVIVITGASSGIGLTTARMAARCGARLVLAARNEEALRVLTAEILQHAGHAVKGFTDALRMELEKAGAPVSVTLVKPTAINTPFPEHARNYMDEEPALPPPLYAPDAVAEAILHCAEKPERDVYVGAPAKRHA